MKNEVTKINSEQLSTKKVVLNCEAMIDHCENEIGFVELKANHRNWWFFVYKCMKYIYINSIKDKERMDNS